MSLDKQNTGYKNWLNFHYIFLKAYLALITIFTAYRIIFFLSYKKGKGTEGLLSDVWMSFITGFRFDTMVSLYLISPMLLFGLLLLIFMKWNKLLVTVFTKVSSIYFSIILLLSVLICVIDFYYFSFFQSHLNILFFGLMNDDTKAVMQFVYNDYPLIRIIIALVLLYIFIAKFLLPKLIFAENKRLDIQRKWLQVLASFLFYVSVFLGLRGTFPTPDSFPLLIDDATVSANTFINAVTLNPIYSLKDGYKALKETEVEPDIEKIVSSNGFASVADAYNYYFNTTKGTNESMPDLFTTIHSLQKKGHPNIVFVQMESMSNQLINFHNKESLNLLGSLEEELQHCYTFRNTISGNNGTIFSLEGLLINTPVAPLSQSKYMHHSFSGASALPFYNAGYDTKFITGAKLGWRNLEKFLPAQYFKELEGDAAIANSVSKAEANEWGMFDEFLFEKVFQDLQKAQKPTFIYAMTTSNHARFTLPSTYKPLPIKLTTEQKKLRPDDVDIFEKNLTTYQYANNCLGNFLKKLRNSPLGKNTIVVATGDHNILGLFNYNDAEMFHQYSVPIIFYVPDEYKPQHIVDVTRFASHKDIFPSIYNLSLDSCRYLDLGNNLFADNSPDNNFFGINEGGLTCSKSGAVHSKQKLLFQWKDFGKKLLSPIKPHENPAIDSLLRKAQAYNVLSNYYIKNELGKKQ